MKSLSMIMFSAAVFVLSTSGAIAQPVNLPVALPPQASPANEAPNVTRAVDCDAGQTIQEAVDNSSTGDVILAKGTCNENVSIGAGRPSLTLDGQQLAIINGLDSTKPTVDVKGRGIVVRNLTISGGRNGVQITDGGTLILDNNLIQYTGDNGISVNQHSSARIVSNIIKINPVSGIFVNQTSSALIGVLAGFDVVTSPNTIQDNATGISVKRGSSARIIGNLIRNNGSHGVEVLTNSNADISSNIINANGGNGISIAQNSGVNLGSDSGNNIYQTPNSTSANNLGNGIRCRNNSYADGRLGSLTGNFGAVNFDTSTATPNGGCINSLIP
jgi:hypothetical protein